MYDFRDIDGNERLISNLSSRIKQGAVHHAYLFDGEKGSGKKTFANAFAKAILCEKKQGYSCNSCTSCRSFESGNNPDVYRMRPEKVKTIGVDRIREEINATVFIKPFLYDKKIYIIEQADAMTVQAQNALLKTLEEAPAFCVFMLAADNTSALLPTVLSRCSLIGMRALDTKTIKRRLERDLSLDSEKAEFYAELSAGNIGRAKEYAGSDEFTALRNFTVELLDGIKKRDLIDLFMQAKQAENFKNNIDVIFDLMLLWYRDMLVAACLNSAEYMILRDLEDKLRNNLPEDISEIAYCIDLIHEIKSGLSKNANFALSFEILLIGLSGCRYNPA